MYGLVPGEMSSGQVTKDNSRNGELQAVMMKQRECVHTGKNNTLIDKHQYLVPTELE